MLKQSVNTINSEFIRARALSQLSFVQFKPYPTSFLGLLSLKLMPKSKKTMESGLDLTPSFKTSVDTMVEGLVSNVDYSENFIQKKCGSKRGLSRTRFVLWTVIFLFFTGFLLCWWLLKVKKESVSPNSLNSFNYFFIFWFKGLSFKTQFKIEFWPPVNGGPLVFE